jgi:hypothetical protein
MSNQLVSTLSFPLAFAACVSLIVACSSTRNKTNVVRTKTETTQTHQNTETPAAMSAEAMPAGDRNVVSSIEFAPGQKKLSPEATAELNRAILEAKQRGQVEEVHVAVWPDQVAPTRAGASFPKTQVQIAKERAENIENYMDQMEPEANIQIHNMTSKSSDFANYLEMQDEITKNRLADAGVSANPETDEVKGPTSSALVFIKVK